MPTSPLPWSRFVALGDSLTEGVGDPVGGELRGWADRLADALRAVDPELLYWNLGRRSLTTSQVRAAQLDKAIELRPDLVSVVAGMNDLLARGFDADAYESDLRGIVAPLAETGATMLMGTFPGNLPALRIMPPRVARAVRSRLADASEVVRAIAADVDAVCADAPDGWRYGMAECSLDGCHPNARGHALIAELALAGLFERAGLDPSGIELGDRRWLPSSLGHLRWLAAQGYLTRPPPPLLAWVRGRSA